MAVKPEVSLKIEGYRKYNEHMHSTFSNLRRFAKRGFVTCLIVLFASAVVAAEVHVAVAANFTAPMKQISQEFEKSTNHKVVLSYGSTGKFYAQIINGAPFDVLLAADNETPEKLEKEGAVVSGTRFTYAIGRLVLWSAKPEMVDEKGGALTRNNFNRLAIAAPRLAPYGAAAIEALAKIGLLSQLQARMVTGDSIGQTFSMVSSGNAEMGFVAMSQVFEDGKLKSGSAWVVPANLHTPLMQDAALLVRARSNPAALQLLTFLKSAQARAIMNSFGYE